MCHQIEVAQNPKVVMSVESFCDQSEIEQGRAKCVKLFGLKSLVIHTVKGGVLVLGTMLTQVISELASF